MIRRCTKINLPGKFLKEGSTNENFKALKLIETILSSCLIFFHYFTYLHIIMQSLTRRKQHVCCISLVCTVEFMCAIEWKDKALGHSVLEFISVINFQKNTVIFQNDNISVRPQYIHCQGFKCFAYSISVKPKVMQLKQIFQILKYKAIICDM